MNLSFLRNGLATLAIISTALLTGCGSNVDIVKDGTMEDYPSATIGKTFESVFDNGQWEVTEKKGKTLVTFTGKISASIHSAAIKRGSYRTVLNEKAEERYTEKYKAAVNKPIEAKYGNVSEEYSTLKLAISEFDDRNYEEDSNYQALCTKESQVKMSIDDLVRYSSTEDQKTKLPSLKKEYEELMTKRKALRTKLGKAINLEAKEKRLSELTGLVSEMESEKNKLHREFFSKRRQHRASAREEIVEEYTWPTGSEVSFTWIVFPDGKGFEIDSFSNNAWAETGETLDQVLALIYE